MTAADATGGASNEPEQAEEVPNAKMVQAEYEKAWAAFEAADALVAKAQYVRSMPAPNTVAELRKRERLVADLEAQADAIRPPPSITGRPIPEPTAARGLISLQERSRENGVRTGAEDPVQRRARRAERFAQLDGQLEKHGDGWRNAGRRGALADLAREEESAGRPMSDKSDVRADLIAAMRE
jgi:hypothetical protein